MPSAANGEVERHAPTPVDNSPIRRVVEILQAKIACLEKQKNKLASGRDVKSGKDSSEQKGGSSAKAEEISQMLEFVWDLCKQAMGIAVLSENEAKKQARKESALRKSQDTQLVRDVLLVLDCLEQLNDPTARSDFLSGSCGAAQLSEKDLQALDDLYPEVAPKHCPEEGLPSFEVQTMNAAKHLVAIIDGSSKEVIGTTYAHLKQVVSSVHECGYLDHPRELRVEELEEEVNEVEEEVVEEIEYVPPPPLTQASPVPAPPPPAPQAVPAPAFPLLPPNAPPVTLQQVEHAYFAQQYGHQQKPPIPEVFGPQSFIFLQESEIDTPETTRQPTPRPISPMPIPSQTFTNQNFAIPTQHFTPELPPNPHINLPQPTTHYQPGITEAPPSHIPGFPSANPPPPIPMPPSHPSLPHMPLPPGQPQALPQPRLPSPSFQQNVSYKQPLVSHSLEEGSVPPSDSSQEDTRASSPEHREPDYSGWNEPEENQTVEQLEINEWNPPLEHGTEQESDPNNHNDGQSAPGKFRPRGRGRGGPPGNFRSRGGYQNGRSGSYYRNSEGYQSRENNGNGGNYNENYRDGNRYENSQGGYQQGGYKGGRGGTSRGGRGESRGSGGRGAGRGSAPRGGGSRPQYPRKPGNQYESRGGADTKQYAH